MALIDFISDTFVDSSTWTQEQKTALLKGFAYYFRTRLDEKWKDGTALDYSNASLLVGFAKDKIAELLITWTKDAQAYEERINRNFVTIEDV
jgi:hypothetical protein